MNIKEIELNRDEVNLIIEELKSLTYKNFEMFKNVSDRIEFEFYQKMKYKQMLAKLIIRKLKTLKYKIKGVKKC